MRRRYEIRVILGVLIWVGLISAGIVFAQISLSGASATTNHLLQFATSIPTTIELDFEDYAVVRVGDPIYLNNDSSTRPIGRITRVENDNSTESNAVITKKAFAILFANAPGVSDQDLLTVHDTPGSMAWVVETMLPPDTRKQIGELILDSYRNNQRDVIDALRPVVQETLRDASVIIRQDFQKAFDKREEQINSIGQRFQYDLIQKEIIPLIKDEIWPIIQAESAPLAEEVGREIWKEISVWRFTWRILYDASPLPQKDLAKQEFKKFLDEKGSPILESHIAEFIEVQKQILQEVANNTTVKKTVSKSIRQVVYDEEVQQMLKDVFTEVFINNPRLQKSLEEKWQTPQAQAAIALTNERLDPTITRIGEILFGSLDTEITPEFSRVMRYKILNKDARWLVLHKSATGVQTVDTVPGTIVRVRPGTPDRELPFKQPATNPN